MRTKLQSSVTITTAHCDILTFCYLLDGTMANLGRRPLPPTAIMLAVAAVSSLASLKAAAFSSLSRRVAQSSCATATATATPCTRLFGSNRNDPAQSDTLSWETFDFSSNPKLDNRFGGDGEDNEAQSLLNSVAKGRKFSSEEFKRITKVEALKDAAAADKLDEAYEAYQQLSPELVAEATAVLEPYINADRLERIDSVLSQRTRHTKFLFENPSNPSNVWACLRTIDSFGVQNVDVIIDSGMYEGKMAISQKSGMRSAMGSAKWLTLRNHPSTADAVRRIKAQGYKIFASDLNPSSIDVRNLDWDGVGDGSGGPAPDDRPVCIVMGNEERGISDEMRQLADATFTLPMCGFAESFNLSVATSITLAHMSARSGSGAGPLRPGDLDTHELACLRLKGLLGSLPQKRMGKSLLKQNDIVLPDAVLALL